MRIGIILVATLALASDPRWARAGGA